jgi:hypothetical protein
MKRIFFLGELVKKENLYQFENGSNFISIDVVSLMPGLYTLILKKEISFILSKQFLIVRN